MRKFLFFVFSLSLFHVALSQTVLSELELTTNRIDQIQAFQVHDSIFLSYTENANKKNYWIGKNGKKRPVLLKISPEAPIVGVLQQADTTFYYYLNDISGNLVLQVMVQAPGNSEIAFARSIFPIQGTLIGLDANGQTITIVTYLKKENRLKVFSLNGLVIQHENIFEMPFDMTPFARGYSGFFSEKELESIERGDHALKFYDEGTDLVMTVDDDQLGKDNSRTWVLKLDVATGKKHLYELKRNDYDKFSSFYYQDRVYQLVISKKAFRFNIYDLKSQTFVFNKEIEKQKTLKDFKVFIRRGKTKEVGYTNLHEMIALDAFPAILVQSTENPTRQRIVLGASDFYYEGGGILLPNPLLGLAATALSLGFSGGHTNTLYFTLTGNTEIGFDFDSLENNTAPSIQRIIDEYEISRTSGKKGFKGWPLLYKGYVETKDGAIGIYQERGKKLTLLKYQAIK